MESRCLRVGDMILGKYAVEHTVLVVRITTHPSIHYNRRYTVHYLECDGLVRTRDICANDEDVDDWPLGCAGVSRDGVHFTVSA